MLTAFILSSLVLALTPGPGVVYIVTRTLSQGRAAGLASVTGVALGNMGMACAAAFGLASLMNLSALAFNLVKWAGVAYLFYLGWKAVRISAAPSLPGADAAVLSGHGVDTFVDSGGRGPRASTWKVCRDGAIVSLLNPKTALFYAAFLPQFVDPAGPALAQSLAYGTGFVAIAAVTDSLYVLAAARLAPLLGSVLPQAGTWTRWLPASVYVGLGLLTALTGQRTPSAP